MTNFPDCKPTVLAEAQFSQDMATTLKAYFTAYQVGGVVTVEVTDHGLWLRNPMGGRQFLGSTSILGNTTVN